MTSFLGFTQGIVGTKWSSTLIEDVDMLLLKFGSVLLTTTFQCL